MCPFCRVGEVPEEPGRHTCPKCGGAFRLDERVECAFVDLDDPVMPLKGTYCKVCGLIQSPYRKRCNLCQVQLDRTEENDPKRQ
jgi:hypothetical protein